MYYCHAIYKTYLNGQVKNDYSKCHASCFSSLGYYPDRSGRTPLDLVEVTFDSIGELTKEQINFYYGFLKEITAGDDYSFSYEFKDKNLEVSLKTNPKNFESRYKALLYLTALRYVQEYPEIVKALIAHKDEPIEIKFDKFQEIHELASNGKIRLVKYGNLAGHGLMYKMYSKERIDLNKFKNNLKSSLKDSVNSYFT